MPDYSFFLSYASSDRVKSDRDAVEAKRNDLIRRFFDDLDGEMKGLAYPDGGFFDKLRLEAKWKSELEVGLASSRILVPLYSRNYFRSPYCGKEWETFNQRFEENEKNRYSDVTFSKVILPIFWKAPVEYPKEVSAYQVDFESYPPDYQKGGLEYLMNFSRNTQAYKKFVYEFSRKLVKLADSQGTAKVRDIRDFDSLNPPFPGNNKPGLKMVRYVFVAGMRHEMPHLRTTCSSYPTVGDRRDWEPCFPDLHRTIEGIATGPAKADSRVYEFLEPSATVMSKLRQARQLNNVIVIVVDPWSLKVNELRQFLSDFDAEDFPNSAVLVNWNPKDPETLAETDQLRLLLQDHFKGRIGRNEFHKDPVSSVENMEQAIVEAFGAVQARLVEIGKIGSTFEGDPVQAPLLRN